MRTLPLLIAPVVTFYFLLWFPLWFLLPFGLAGPVRIVAGLVGAISVARYIWKRPDGPLLPEGVGGSVAIGAVSVGAVGFLGGFIGPILLMPEANQGPLLGIFFTGPLGVVIGAIGGGLLAVWRRRNSDEENAEEI